MRDMLNTTLNILITFLVLINVILACFYINNSGCNERENYEYGIKLYRDTVNKQYSQFCKNNPN